MDRARGLSHDPLDRRLEMGGGGLTKIIVSANAEFSVAHFEIGDYEGEIDDEEFSAVWDAARAAEHDWQLAHILEAIVEC